MLDWTDLECGKFYVGPNVSFSALAPPNFLRDPIFMTFSKIIILFKHYKNKKLDNFENLVHFFFFLIVIILSCSSKAWSRDILFHR